MKKNNTNTEDEPIEKVVPSISGFMDLVGYGAKMSLGMAAAGFVGSFASRFKAPIPLISNRSLAGGVTTILLYAGYRNVEGEMVKDILHYAAAGAAVRTAGSLVFDILYATKLQVPFMNYAVMTMSGVPPISVERGKVEDAPGAESTVDTDTRFS